MRRDWFCSPAAVAVTAALFGGAPLCASAAPLLLAASVASGDGGGKVVAQASALPPPMAGEAGESANGEATTETVGGEAGAVELPAAPNADEPVTEGAPGAPAVGDGAASAPPVVVPRVAAPLPGDDALPTAQELRNNPYLIQQSDADGLFTGDLSGAYVPPPAPPTQEEKLESQSAEMVSILGPEAYNRRVNITTPPDTEVAEVVRLLAERAGLNFVYAEGVIGGRVTLNLRDVPLGAALQSLLASQGLVIIREGTNVMRIAPRQEASGGLAIETRTIYIKLNWVPAPSLIPAITSVLQAGKVTAQAEANTLIVTDVPGNIELIRELVQQLDVPDKQVMIEARMVEFLLDYGRNQGSQTAIESRDDSGNSFGDQVVGRPYSILDPLGSGEIVQTPDDLRLPVDQLASTLIGSQGNPTLSFGGVISIFGKEFNVATTLDALEDRRIVNILANPRVITLNNQEAFIDIKREIPYLEAQQGVGQDILEVSVSFKESGVSIRVLPNITNSGFVRMRLEPQQRIVAGEVGNPAGGTIPIIDTRQAVTNVIVKDEDTIVLGGLREIDSSQFRQQIPWLGQVPVIGWFFKSASKSHLKNELMLFVTPHIVKAPVLAPAEMYKYSRIDNHWDLPDFFFDDSIESRENHHRFEMDMDANSYYPMPLRLPPPAPSLAPPPAPGAPVAGATELEPALLPEEPAGK